MLPNSAFFFSACSAAIYSDITKALRKVSFENFSAFNIAFADQCVNVNSHNILQGAEAPVKVRQ